MRARTKFRDEVAISNEKFDAIEFILAVLRQHEKEFDRLIGKLGRITLQLRETEKTIRRIEEIDKKLEMLRSEILNIRKCNPINR